METQDVFPGRQPIRDQCSIAYELLFRAGNTSGVTVTADMLLQREGELGSLLRLVESVEHPDLKDTPLSLAQSGALSLSDLTAAEIDAMSRANQIAESKT